MIIPNPTRSRKFKMLPIPNSLSSVKIVKIEEITKPLLEFPKINDVVKKRAVNKLMKKRNIKIET